MAFSKNTYSPGDVLTSEQMNNIQDAILTNKGNIESHITSNNPHKVTPEQIGAAANNHTHYYAKSSSVGGAATSADKLNTDAGSKTQPVYFVNGVPVPTAHTLGASVPSNAKFTDTTYTLGSFGITATAAELNHMDGVTANVQTQLNGKASSSHNHNASNINSGTLSTDRLPTVPITKGGTGATTAASALTNLGITATATELNYCDGVKSNIQTQLNGKAASNHGNHVPATETANNAKFLRNDNTWQVVTPANIGALATNGTAVSANKLAMSNGTFNLLEFAESCEVGVTSFATNNETTGLPSESYIYGTGEVMKRSNNFIYIELHPYNTKSNPIARNTYNNGSWYGWTYDYSEANKPTASDIGAAPESHEHDATDITSGTLSSDRLPTVPITKGGTGSNNGATGLKNLLAAGNTVLSSYQYGTSLPSAGTKGRIFFKKVSS